MTARADGARSGRCRSIRAAGLLAAVLLAPLLGVSPRAAADGGRQAIVVAGEKIDVGRPVVLWNEPEGFDGYAQSCLEPGAAAKSACCAKSFKRFGARRDLRERTFAALQRTVRQVVLHQDGCVNARSCFYSMHDMPRPDGGCGLSAHFMVDSDGTIYQTLDLLESAWHAEQSNGVSIGIELCNRGDAGRNELDRLPREYRTRPVRRVVINGEAHQAFDFRPEQYTSVLALLRTLVRTLPRVRPQFPEDDDGQARLQTLEDPLDFDGIVGHLHVDRQRRKWDPGAFDWSRLRSALHALHFPISVRGYDTVPTDPDELRRAALALFRNAEDRGSGFFPVGAGGLWHSGVHLRGAAGEPVSAPLRGRIVAARIAEHEGTSTSFVLVRHESVAFGEPFVFFSLLAHLAPDALRPERQPPWLHNVMAAADPTARRALEAGRVALVDEPVEAGDVVGRIGWVRWGAERGPEVHFEIFTAERAPEPLEEAFQPMNAIDSGPIAAGGVRRLVDRDGDGRIDAVELRAFFRGGDPLRKSGLRQLVVRHVHEWGDRAGRHGKLPEARSRLYEAWQRWSEPYRFLDDAVTAHAGLPETQIVHSYHPIAFLVALAAADGKISFPWPRRHSVEIADVPLAAPRSEDFAPPADVAQELEPLFGPVVEGEAAIKGRSDVPLIELPPVEPP